MKILSLSDTIVPYIYGPQVRSRFRDTELILGCGDLSYYYLEYVMTALDVPLFFVRGNHDKVVEYGSEGQRTHPHGGFDLHRKHSSYKGLLLSGVEGSLRYRNGNFQYSQAEMFSHIFALIPGMLLNRLRYGRYLDVFISHAPPAGIHDQEDLPHQGIKAFKWLIEVFRPKLFIHGHIHVLRPDTLKKTVYRNTLVLNTYGFQEIAVETP